MAEKKSPAGIEGFAAHEREQILAKARDTTPSQRVLWVEEAVRLFAPQLAEASRRDPKKYS